MQQLAQQLKNIDEDHKLLVELFDILRSGPDDVVAAALARIRFGENVADIVRSSDREDWSETIRGPSLYVRFYIPFRAVLVCPSYDLTELLAARFASSSASQEDEDMDAPAEDDDEIQAPTEVSWQSWSSQAEKAQVPYPQIRRESTGNSRRASEMVGRYG